MNTSEQKGRETDGKNIRDTENDIKSHTRARLSVCIFVLCSNVTNGSSCSHLCISIGEDDASSEKSLIRDANQSSDSRGPPRTPLVLLR